MIRFIIVLMVLMLPLSAELARSVPNRRAEFLAGCYLARHVLEKLGINQFTLLSSQDRSPVWPENLCCSLATTIKTARCARFTAVVIYCHIFSDCHIFSGVGVDVETLVSDDRAASLWPGIRVTRNANGSRSGYAVLPGADIEIFCQGELV
ncbi:MAG: hypothetical protein ACR5LF_12010 [Symbiopectobacterium sp.]